MVHRSGHTASETEMPRARGIDVPAAPVSSALLQVIRALATRATAALAPLGLVPPQEVVLLYVAERGECTQADLVRYLERDRSTVTNMVQAMERSGLISRRAADADRRMRVVTLTNAAVALVPAVQEMWAGLESDIVGEMSREEVAEFARALHQIALQLAERSS